MFKHGGKRVGAGRKRIHSKGVAHREREYVHSRVPLHINFKYRLNIRNKERLKLLKRAILNARKKGLRIIEYSLQRNHIHLIAEADNNVTLERGMRALTVTMARGIELGHVQIQRYHLHILRSYKETRNALHYVLFNEQRHSGIRVIEMNGYASLHFHQEIISIAKNWKMKILWDDLKRALLDEAKTFHLQKAQLNLVFSSLDTASVALRKSLCP